MSQHQNSAIRREREPRVEHNENGFALKPVQSSAIHAVGYDAAKKVLHVRFVEGGNTYEYPDVSAEQHEAFLSADSMGKHFRQAILGRDFHKRDAS